MMLRLLLTFCIMSIAISVIGRQDSTLKISTILYHSADRDIVNLMPINYTIGLIEFALKDQILVGYIGHKTNGFVKGNQYGLEWYKKQNRGYGHISIKHSRSSFYPVLSVEGNYYRTVSKGLELGLGYRYLSYVSGENSHALGGKLYYYTGNWLMNYRFTRLNSGRIYHHGAARLMVAGDQSYIEISLTDASETIFEQTFDELVLSGISIGIKGNIALSSKTNLFASVNYLSRSDGEIRSGALLYSMGAKHTWK